MLVVTEVQTRMLRSQSTKCVTQFTSHRCIPDLPQIQSFSLGRVWYKLQGIKQNCTHSIFLTTLNTDVKWIMETKLSLFVSLLVCLFVYEKERTKDSAFHLKNCIIVEKLIKL